MRRAPGEERGQIRLGGDELHVEAVEQTRLTEGVERDRRIPRERGRDGIAFVAAHGIQLFTRACRARTCAFNVSSDPVNAAALVRYVAPGCSPFAPTA